VAELRSGADHTHQVIAYARRPADIPAIESALNRFAPTLPGGDRLVTLTPSRAALQGSGIGGNPG
jgi:hypothetical protein